MDRDPDGRASNSQDEHDEPQRDAQLMAQCRDSGDPEAFARLLARYRPVVLGFIARQMGDPEVVEELFINTFLRAHTVIESWREPQSVAAWLLTIAANLCRAHVRRRAEGQPPAPPPSAASLVADGMTQEEAARARENHRRIEQALDQLTDAQREVVVLQLYAGLDRATVSDVLKLPQSTVKARLTTALYRLRPTLDALATEADGQQEPGT